MDFKISNYGDEEILGSLKPFQRTLVLELLVNHDEETAAKMWLSSTGPLDLRQFGGAPEPGGDAFYQRFRSEFRAYVCGSERYERERQEFMRLANPAANYVVTAISVAVAGTLGVAVGLVVPAVALLLKVVGKLGLNAWCHVDA